MATPHVAGSVALLAQAAPHSTAAERLTALRAAHPDALIADQRTSGVVTGLPPLDVRWALGELPGADGAPTAPIGVAAEVPEGEAADTRGLLEVRWDAPTVDVTHHAVAHPGGRWCSAAPATDTCTITGLADTTDYTVRVTATDATGATSTASERTPVVTTTAGLPGAVRELTGQVGDTDVALGWTVPTRGPIDDYEVELSALDDASATIPTLPDACAETATPGCAITGLDTGTSYLATVRATNHVGPGPDATFTFTPGLPSAPRELVATRGDRAVNVSWSAPATDGGPAITAYTVTTRQPDGTLTPGCQTDGAASSCTVDGLDNGVRYRFSVAATNTNGPGPSSTESSEVTPAGLPFAPTDVVATVPAASGTLDVSWVAADGNGAEVTGYEAVAVSADQNRGCTPVGTATSCTITGLTDDVEVAITVTATSEVGTGDASTAVTATPTDPHQTTSDDTGGSDTGTGGDSGGAGGGGSLGGGGGGGGGAATPEEPSDDEVADGPVTVGGTTPAPTTGTSELLVGGVTASATTTSTSRALVLDAAGIRSELSAQADDGTPSPVRTGTVTLPPGGRIDLTTSGLQADTRLVGWLFSEPVRLGTVAVGSDGRATGSLDVPTSLPAGAHTLQLVGVTADGEQFAWSIGVQFEDITSRFPDVGVGVTHWFAIESIAEQGVTLGDTTGNYRPAASLTRGQMARFLTRVLALPTGEPTGLRDIEGTQHQVAIEAVVAAGIASGFTDGTFRPDEPVTRGQLATFLAAAADLDEVADGPSTDVAGTTHERRIHAVVAAGIATGFDDGTYRPGITVTRAQMATLLVGLADELAER